MIRKKEEFGAKNKKDVKVTDNSFTQAVKKAGNGGEREEPQKKDFDSVELVKKPLNKLSTSELRARDELMRAKEARNETTCESEQFRRDEKQCIIRSRKLRVCCYPIVNNPHWDTFRNCPNGLWGYANDFGEREIYALLAKEFRKHSRAF